MMVSDCVESHFIVFESCKFVKGVNRSLICDLQRGSYTYIPNDMYDIVFDNLHSTIAHIIDLYGKENSNTIIEYFDFLHKSEMIYLCSKDELEKFPPIDTSYIQPSSITNAVIDVSYINVIYLESIFNQLEELGCSSIHLKFYFNIDLDFLNSVLKLLNQSVITSVELFIPFDNCLTNNRIVQFANSFNRLFKIVIYNSPQFSINESGSINTIIVFLDKNISENSCGIINEQNFSVNFDTYFESLSFNSCLNKKISIDRFGEIKNCPSMVNSYGNILDTKLSDIIVNSDFIKLWYINKSSINTCNACEHRYICTDCRAFLDNPFDKYSKPLKCGYDPYTTQWTEWSTNPLKNAAISYYGLIV